MDIASLQLHDATLETVELDWARSTCRLYLATAKFPKCAVIFSGVSEVIIPKAEPWGASQSINSAVARADGVYEIEMQSGDVLRICASNISFDTDAQGRRPT